MLKKLGCDFLVFSGHKMLAPTGIGILYISNNMAEKLDSPKLGGNTVEEIFIENEKLNLNHLILPINSNQELQILQELLGLKRQ